MKKVFIIAYSKTNLGDDLFIDILVNRYKNIEFYTKSIEDYSYIMNKNANLNFRDYNLDDLINNSITEFDGIVYIGGSIFMEHAGGVERIRKLNTIAKKCKESDIPFFFISSNFGPYTTEEYKNEVKKLMENTTDICFRDEYSYNNFKEITGVRYAPDVVLSYSIPYEKKENTIGISVINFWHRDEIKQYEKHYFDVLKNSIINYVEEGKKVTLFSFCEYEGDEQAIHTILEMIPEKYLNNVDYENYKGNIDEFIKKYSEMEYFICSRFHSMILSAVFNQQTTVISYSNKINNVLKDLELTDKVVDVTTMKHLQNLELKEFNRLNMTSDISQKANNQFEQFELKMCM